MLLLTPSGAPEVRHGLGRNAWRWISNVCDSAWEPDSHIFVGSAVSVFQTLHGQSGGDHPLGTGTRSVTPHLLFIQSLRLFHSLYLKRIFKNH